MRVLGFVAAAMLAGCSAEVVETDTPAETDASVSEAAATAPDVDSSMASAVDADAVAIDMCSLSSQSRWAYAEGMSVTIDAAVFCEDGQRIARRDILGGDGERLYEFSARAEHVAVLAWAESDAEFVAAFDEWAGHDTWRTRTSELPVYDQQAEFPFYPSTQDPAQFEAWRAGDYPMDCFLQGKDSQMCVALIDGVAVEMGVQSFPG